MRLPMLAVESNIEVSQPEQTEWQKHSIATVRVTSMQEAIKKLDEMDSDISVVLR